MRIFRDTEGVATRLVMRKPDDWHVHVRTGDMLKLVAPMTARQFGRAVCMPNLKPPITTAAMVQEYRQQIIDAVEAGMPNGWNGSFTPLMTLYITDTMDPGEIEKSVEHGLLGVKYYPPGLTTNSDSGVKNPTSLWTHGTKPYDSLRELARVGKTLMLHAANGFDSSGEELDPYDQETDFVKEALPRIRDAHPELKVSFEHLSTEEGAYYMRKEGGPKLGCSITAQHMLLDRRDTHRGGLHVHKHWWPIIQGKKHRIAVSLLATSGLPFVYLGTDSAPHPIASKEAECCVGGVLTAHCAMELYIEAFERENKLDRLEFFASEAGAHFYGLRLNDDNAVFERQEWTVDREIKFTEADVSHRESHLKPFRFGQKVAWKQVA